MLADKCLELLGKDEHDTAGGVEVANARAKAVKGLVDLVCGNLGSGAPQSIVAFTCFIILAECFSASVQLSHYFKDLRKVKVLLVSVSFCSADFLGCAVIPYANVVNVVCRTCCIIIWRVLAYHRKLFIGKGPV